MDQQNSKFLKIEGDVSVTPVTKVGENSWRYLIMGPTGAGKSSFVEALAGESEPLGISKDQLSGCTQKVQAYQVVNVTYDDVPVYLIDTPGFSDTKISEFEIMDMVYKWLQENGLTFVQNVLFLTPVTETRLAGSKRKTIDMVVEFLRSSSDLESATFVTTMWDRLYNERIQKRAESNFVRLRDDILEDSAIQILGGSITTWSAFDSGLTKISRSPQLYQDLHERIEGALQEQKNIESDLAHPESKTNLELNAILIAKKRENEEILIKFIEQLARFGEPPAGFEEASERLRRTIAAEVTPINSRYEDIYQAWAKGQEFLEPPEPHSPSISARQPPIGDNQPSPPRILALKGLLRRLLNVIKRRSNKLFKRRD